MSVRYHVVGAGTVTPGILECGIVFAASIWKTVTWFLTVGDYRHNVWVMLMGVGMSGLVLVWVE